MDENTPNGTPRPEQAADRDASQPTGQQPVAQQPVPQQPVAHQTVPQQPVPPPSPSAAYTAQGSYAPDGTWVPAAAAAGDGAAVPTVPAVPGPAADAHRRTRRVLVGSVALAFVVGGGVGFGASAVAHSGSDGSTSDVAQGGFGSGQGMGGEGFGGGPGTSGQSSGQSFGEGGASQGGEGSQGSGGFGPGMQSGSDGSGTGTGTGIGTGSGTGSGSGSVDGSGLSDGTGTNTAYQDVTVATADQSKGVVIVQTLTDDGAAAGTGVVLTSSGEVVTNAHVIEGATRVVVTDPSTGTSYDATVVGKSTTSDVAVLQLKDASGLTTATWDDDGDPAVGDDVTAVGNAGGTGTLVAAAGDVEQLDASITTAATQGETSESLSGLIVVDADVVAGDSGGALLDDQGEVVGMTTAATSGTRDVTGYAIPADDVLTVVHRILARVDA